MRKRLLAMLLAVMMILSLLPTTALAAGSITELKLMQGDSAVFDLLNSSGGTVNLDVDTQYTLSMQLSSPTTLTITLPEGMKFVGLEPNQFTGLGIDSAAWVKNSAIYGYQPDNGTLTVSLASGASSATISGVEPVSVRPVESKVTVAYTGLFECSFNASTHALSS